MIGAERIFAKHSESWCYRAQRESLEFFIVASVMLTNMGNQQ